MNTYQLLLEGKNFLIMIDGTPKKMGFYTTRWVTAQTPEEAEQTAVEQIRNDEHLRATVCNAPSDPPMIYAEEIIEREHVDAMTSERGVGYTFYPEESEKENLFHTFTQWLKQKISSSKRAS